MAAARGDPQQQLLTLIRDFATEKSHGEWRVSDLKKRLLDLRSELEAATAHLEDAKHYREATEHGLKGSEVEISMADASILAQETRTRLLQEAISEVRSDLAVLKNEEGVLRDEFINAMFELNKRTRKFQETVHFLQKKQCLGSLSDDGKMIKDKKVFNAQDLLRGVEEKISDTNVLMHTLEQEYEEELHAHDEVLQVLANVERRVFLGEAIMEETKQLQELARQTAESEKTYASLGMELQKRYKCPSCQFNNMGGLEGTFLSQGDG